MKKKAIEQIRNTFPKITLTVFSLDFHNASGISMVISFQEKNVGMKNVKFLDCDDASGCDEAFNG